MFNCITLDDYLDAFSKITPVLSRHRIEHMISVAYTSTSLAMFYGADVEKAYIIGLLHDIAKGYNDEELLDACKIYSIPMTEVEKEFPFLLHGKVGAYLAEHEFGVTDEEILEAIKYHVTGRPEMSVLTKIVYIADFIEPGRGRKLPMDKRENFEHFGKKREDFIHSEKENKDKPVCSNKINSFAIGRQEAYKGLDHAVYVISGLTLEFLRAKNKVIDETTQATHDYYDTASNEEV